MLKGAAVLQPHKDQEDTRVMHHPRGPARAPPLRPGRCSTTRGPGPFRCGPARDLCWPLCPFPPACRRSRRCWPRRTLRPRPTPCSNTPSSRPRRKPNCRRRHSSSSRRRRSSFRPSCSGRRQGSRTPPSPPPPGISSHWLPPSAP